MRLPSTITVILAMMWGSCSAQAAEPAGPKRTPQPVGQSARSAAPANAPDKGTAPGSQPQRAAPATHEPEPAPTIERRVDFRARRVDLGAERDELRLSGDVVVSVDRYRLTSDELRLERTPRGVVVDGSGRVAFCPCPDPPVSLGFQSALVAPPNDLLLEQPTVRVGSVPIAWLPYLWLRSPRRFGVLPPKVAWRGEDGLLAGSGVHVPFGEGQMSALDVAAAGYVEGGVDVETRLTTARTTSRVRWDHLRESLLDVEMLGSSVPVDDGVIAWSVEAIRGPRALPGTILLEDAARRYDRAAVAAGRAGGQATYGIALRADAERGGPMDDAGLAGPAASLALGSALGSVGGADARLAVRTASDEGEATTFVVPGADAYLDARPGPLTARLSGRARAEVDVEEQDAARAGAAGVVLTVGMPLARDYGTLDDPVEHEVEPFAEGGLGLGSIVGTPVGPWLFPDEPFVHAAAGVRTGLGAYGRRSGMSLEGRGGWVGTPSRVEPAVSTRVTASARLLAARGELGWLPESERAFVAIARARLGRQDDVHIGTSIEGRSEATPVEVRLLEEGGWETTQSPWFDRRGWTAGGEIGVPWTRWLATAARADYDIVAEVLLALRGAIGYRHPCGCLALVAWAGRRIGRESFDAWLTIDLVPR